jgi:hypothetical protein
LSACCFQVHSSQPKARSTLRRLPIRQMLFWIHFNHFFTKWHNPRKLVIHCMPLIWLYYNNGIIKGFIQNAINRLHSRCNEDAIVRLWKYFSENCNWRFSIAIASSSQSILWGKFPFNGILFIRLIMLFWIITVLILYYFLLQSMVH